MGKVYYDTDNDTEVMDLQPIPYFKFMGRLETAKERHSDWNKQLSLVFLV